MTTEIPTVRCSSLGRVINCAASEAPGGLRITEAHDAATMGTAAHDGVQRTDAGLPVDVAALAALHGVDEGELGWLLANGRAILPEFAGPEGALVVREESMAADLGWVRLTGQIDRAWIQGHRAGIQDWKTGRHDSDHRDQLMGQARLVFERYQEVDEITATVVWLRDKTEESYAITRDDMPAWLDKLRNALRAPDVFRTGEHCAFCPRRHECPALGQLTRAAVVALDPTVGDSPLATLTPAQQIHLYRMAGMVEAQVRRVRDGVRTILEAGPIDDGATVLRLDEEHQRRIDPLKAWPLMQERLTDAQMADVVKVGIQALESAVSEGAPPRGKAAAKREFTAALEAAGAVSRIAVKKVREERKRG